MKKEDKITWILTTVVCLLPIAAALLVYDRLPEQIATHWDASGQPNGWGSRFQGAILYPGLVVLLNLALPFLMRMDPRYTNMNSKLRILVQWTIPVISVFCSWTTLSSGLGYDSKVAATAPLLFGFMLICIGNYLPKTKRSYTLGIRLPWTLDSDENWNKTHRIAGFLWVLGGFVIMASSLFTWRIYVIIPTFCLMTLVPVICSYAIYVREGKKTNTSEETV